MSQCGGRVTVYRLSDEQGWEDQGIGYASCYLEDSENTASILVTSEPICGELLLQVLITAQYRFQRQTTTIITWSQDDGLDTVLSFEKEEDCDQLWMELKKIWKDTRSPLGESSAMNVDADASSCDDISLSMFDLPPCNVDNLPKINDIIIESLQDQALTDYVAEKIDENDQFIHELLSLFRSCEAEKDLASLHHLFETFKAMFMYNKSPLTEIMSSEENIMDVIGCFEYDPHRAPVKHREYLANVSFQNVLSLNEPFLIQKIHYAYKLQYLHDVLTPHLGPFMVDENLLSCFDSYLSLIRSQIMASIDDTHKPRQAIAELSMIPEGSQRRERILFLKEYCLHAKELYISGVRSSSFLQTVGNKYLLQVVQQCFRSNDSTVQEASAAILTYIAEADVSIIQRYILEQNAERMQNPLLRNIFETISSKNDSGSEVKAHLLTTLSCLISTDDTKLRMEFLPLFYDHAIDSFKSFDASPEEIDYSSAEFLATILDMLQCLPDYNGVLCTTFLTQPDLSTKIISMMNTKHAFLSASIIRFLKKLVSLGNHDYYKHIIACKLLDPIVSAFVKNGGRYNLLESAIIDFFEYITSEGIHILCKHVVSKYGHLFENLHYVQTFHKMKLQLSIFDTKMKQSFSTTLDDSVTDQSNDVEEEKTAFPESCYFPDAAKIVSK